MNYMSAYFSCRYFRKVGPRLFGICGERDGPDYQRMMVVMMMMMMMMIMYSDDNFSGKYWSIVGSKLSGPPSNLPTDHWFQLPLFSLLAPAEDVCLGCLQMAEAARHRFLISSYLIKQMKATNSRLSALLFCNGRNSSESVWLLGPLQELWIFVSWPTLFIFGRGSIRHRLLGCRAQLEEQIRSPRLQTIHVHWRILRTCRRCCKPGPTVLRVLQHQRFYYCFRKLPNLWLSKTWQNVTACFVTALPVLLL